MVPVMGHHPSLVTARYTSLYNIDSMFIKKMSVHDRLLNSAKSCRIFFGGIEPDVLSFLNCLHKEEKHVFGHKEQS